MDYAKIRQNLPPGGVVLPPEEAQQLRENVEVIVDLAQRVLDACTEFNATLGGGCGLGG